MAEWAATFGAKFHEDGDMHAQFGDVQKVSTSDYESLYNLPSINGVTIKGAKTSPDYHLQDEMQVLSQTDIEKILYLG